MESGWPMPEGDTIFKAARTLEKAIGGETITGFRSALPKFRDVEISGKRIEKIEPRGKNLLMFLNDGRVLHTHMMMTGSWHIYRSGEKWQKPESQAKVVIETAKFVAVCFNAPVVDLLSPDQLRRNDDLHQLGPDILRDDFDFSLALKRLRECVEMEISDALLAQRAIAGIGNIYKCETLFLCGVNPFVPVKNFSDEILGKLIREARKLMKGNLNRGMRTTRGSLHGERFWVYGRGGKRCLRCGEIIRIDRKGRALRLTYWCPKCQRA
jgi:endonuclease-8